MRTVLEVTYDPTSTFSSERPPRSPQTVCPPLKGRERRETLHYTFRELKNKAQLAP